MGRAWEGALLAIWVLGSLVGVVIVVGSLFSSVPFLAIFAAIPPVIPYMLWRNVRRRRLGLETIPTHPTSNPVAVPTQESLAEIDVLTNVDGPFTACPRCGFLGLRMPGMGDGLWPGGGETGSRMVCPRCDFQGIPVEFDDADSYQKFVEALRAEAGAA